MRPACLTGRERQKFATGPVSVPLRKFDRDVFGPIHEDELAVVEIHDPVAQLDPGGGQLCDLGDVLKQLKATKPMENFSAVAMEFAGYKFEEALSRGPVAADRMCLALIDFLRLRPAYIRRVRRGSKKYLTGTGRFRRETGMRLWLRVE